MTMKNRLNYDPLNPKVLSNEEMSSTTEVSSVVQQEGKRKVTRKISAYNFHQ